MGFSDAHRGLRNAKPVSAEPLGARSRQGSRTPRGEPKRRRYRARSDKEISKRRDSRASGLGAERSGVKLKRSVWLGQMGLHGQPEQWGFIVSCVQWEVGGKGML